MPIVTLHITEGQDAARKAALLQASTQAIEASIGAPINSIRIMMQEYKAENVMLAGQAGQTLVHYQTYLIAGRMPEQKAALISALNGAACLALGVTGNQVRVTVLDVPKTDMGVADGITALAAGR